MKATELLLDIIEKQSEIIALKDEQIKNLESQIKILNMDNWKFFLISTNQTKNNVRKPNRALF